MPWCPVCRYEYAAGIRRCPNDDVELVTERPPAREVTEATEIYRSSNIAAVDAVAAWLAERGLSAEIIDRPAGGVMGRSATFAVTLPTEAAKSVADDLEAAIEEIEAELEFGESESDAEEEEEEEAEDEGTEDEF